MLKRIDIKQLRVGMYCSSWVNTLSWVKKPFLVNDLNQLEQIINSGVKEVCIDTSKGLDVLPEPVSLPIATKPDSPELLETIDLTTTPLPMNEELKRASKVINRSKEAITSMFNEARMGKVVDVEPAVSLVEEITSSVMRNPSALIGLVRLKTKDDYTYMHSIAVCALMVSLARQLGLSDEQIRESGLAGLLHDVGKMTIPSEILNKPGKLTTEEFAVVQEHSAAGHRMLLEGGTAGDTALEVCLHHHEKMNGTGYPDRLAGDSISVFARMGAVCDVYDAITSNRPYKQGWCPSEALRNMAGWEGHFDENIFQAFVKSIGIYPVGTLLRLHSGRLGVVVEQQTGKSLLLPKVKVFFSCKFKSYIIPEILDLADPGIGDKIVAREDALKWDLKDINKYWLGDEAG